MTAVLEAPAHRRVERAVRRSEELGPIATAAGSLFVAAGTLTVFRAYPYEPFVTALFGLIAAGFLFLAPAKRVRRMPVPMASLLVLVWFVASLEWTIDPVETPFGLRLEMPMLVGFWLAGALLPVERIGQALVVAVRAGVVMTLLAVAAFPWARRAGEGELVIDGWRGLFVAKNALALFLVFGLIVALVWERHRTWRWVTLGGLLVCLVGARSATGISGFIVVGVCYLWLRHYTRLRGRSGPAFVVTSAAVLVCTVVAAAFSVSSLTSLYGKDLTFSGRTDVWDASLSTIAERPFTGYGIRSVFILPGNDLTLELWNDIGFQVAHAHSGVISLALQVGLVGVALFLVLHIATLVGAVRIFPERQRLGATAILFLVTVLVLSLSESTFEGPWLAILLMLAALLRRRDLGPPDRIWADERRPR